MNTIDRINKLIKLGYTADFDSGIIYNSKGDKVSRTSGGYIIIAVRNENKTVNVKGHQFIFYLKNKYVPGIIDHINRDTMDNRISNLREVTKSVNTLNNGAKGYSYINRLGRYRAQITINGKFISLGLYDTPEEASNAYITEKQKYIL